MHGSIRQREEGGSTPLFRTSAFPFWSVCWHTWELSPVRFFEIPWTVDLQAPLSMEFSMESTTVDYHFFFIHSSSLSGHLGGFIDVLAIVNSASMNIGVPVSYLKYGFPRVYAHSEIAGSHGVF